MSIVSPDILAGADVVRTHRARKTHRCSGCGKDVIEKGDKYWLAVVFPGSGQYQIAPDDYETEDWPFGAFKVCKDCFFDVDHEWHHEDAWLQEDEASLG